MTTLSEIQKKLKAPKSQYNSFGSYNYRNCEDILEALKPLLNDDDIFYITDSIEQVGDRYYIKATATFNNITVSSYARESLDKKGMDSAQITGATSSYARKYALNGLFAIDDTKDADSQDNTNHKTETKKEEPKKPSKAELKKAYEARLAKFDKVDNKEKYNQLKPLKDKWVSWAKSTFGEEYGDQMNNKFIEMMKIYEPIHVAQDLDDEIKY